MRKKLPHIPFYTGDYMKDPELSLCTSATRGIWMDLLCAMHESDRSGELRGTSEQLARLARCSTVELDHALADLQTSRAANVEKRSGVWTIANRRMKREAALREKRASAGSIGGSKTQANREQKPDTDSDIECQRIIEEFCVSLGLPKKDGTACFHKWFGNGWTNGGEPIRDWKATIRSWKAAGYMPSQKVGHGSNGRGPVTPAKGPPKPQPAGWDAWRRKHYPESTVADFWRVPGDVQAEFRKNA
jgi:uncharacterized protein YdaU (DUF1376 family)